MTGIEALVALQEGKKVTKPCYKGSYYAYMIEHELYAKPYKSIVWIGTWEQSPIDPMVWYNSDIVNVDLFLQDDWEVVE